MASRKKLTLKEAYAKDGKPKNKKGHIRRKRAFPTDSDDSQSEQLPLKARCFGPSEEDKKFTDENTDYLQVIKTYPFISKASMATEDQKVVAYELIKLLIAGLKKSQECYPEAEAGYSMRLDIRIRDDPKCLIPSGIPHEEDNDTEKMETVETIREVETCKLEQLSNTNLVEPTVIRRCNSLPAFPTFKQSLGGDVRRTASCRALNEKLWHELTVMNSFVSALANSYSKTKMEKETSISRVPPADENGFIQYYSDFPDEEEDHETKIKKLETLDFMFLKRPTKKREKESEDSSSVEDDSVEESGIDFTSYLPNFVRKLAEFTGLVPMCSSRAAEEHSPDPRARREYSDETMEEKGYFFSCNVQ